MLMTAALWMPARMVPNASGSSMRQRIARAREPQRLRRLAQRARNRREAGVGVADDRKQAVEKQRCGRWPGADAEQRDHEDQQRQRGDRLDDADRGQHDLSQARTARHQDAERQRAEDGRQQRHGDQRQVLARPAPERRPARLFGAGRPDAEPLGDEVRGDGPLRDLVELHAGVEAHHRGVVDLPGHPAQRRKGRWPARLGVAAVEQDRLVAREEPAIVGQHAQPIARDLGVGRIDVGHVERAGGKAADRQLVIEPLDLPVGERVARRQAGPAVAPAQELVAEVDAQLGVAGEIGDRADAEARRRLLAHRERVAVVEPERPDETEPPRRQRGPQRGEVSRTPPRREALSPRRISSRSVPVYSG